MNTKDRIYNLVVELSNSEPEHFSDKTEALLIKLLDTYAKEAKAEQRQRCADAVEDKVIESWDRNAVLAKDMYEACLNATGESDG